jgi:hypothetical protein
MKNPFEGHPYRDGVSKQERIEMQKQELAQRFRRILETIQQKDGINTLSGEDKELGELIWTYLQVENKGLIKNAYKVTINYDGLAYGLHVPIEATKFFKKFSVMDLSDFKHHWIPTY